MLHKDNGYITRLFMAGITAFAYAVLFRGSLYDGVAAFFAGAIALGIMSVFAMFRIVKRKKL